MAVAGADDRRPRRIRLVVGGSALVVVLAVIGALAFFGEPAHRGSTSQPVAIAQAVADFRDGRLPPGSPGAHRAPDLSGIGFALVGQFNATTMIAEAAERCHPKGTHTMSPIMRSIFTSTAHSQFGL